MNCETYKRTRPVILSVENDSEIEADQARTYRLIIHILSFLLYWKETLLLFVFNWYFVCFRFWNTKTRSKEM